METSDLLDSTEPNMRHLAHVFLCWLDLMLTDVDHSVCHDPSLFSEFKEAGKSSRLPLKNSTYGASSSTLYHWERESTMFCLKAKIASDIHWLFLK